MSEDRVEEALDMVRFAAESTGSRPSPLRLQVSQHFLVRDPGTKIPLPGQDPERFHHLEYTYGTKLGASGMLLNGPRQGTELFFEAVAE